MTITFNTLFQSVYSNPEDVEKDSPARAKIGVQIEESQELIEDFEEYESTDYANTKANQLREKTIEQLESDDQEELEYFALFARDLFDFYLKIPAVLKELKNSQLSEEEKKWLQDEIPSMLEYLEVIQNDCKEHLKTFPKTYEKLTPIRETVLKWKTQLKNWLPKVEDKSSEEDSPERLQIDKTDLISISPSLEKLVNNLEELKKIKKQADNLFKQLDDDTLGNPPTLRSYQVLTDSLSAIQTVEINVPEGLLEKVRFYSLVAAQILENISEESRLLHNQCTKIKEGIPDEVEFSQKLEFFYKNQVSQIKQSYQSECFFPIQSLVQTSGNSINLLAVKTLYHFCLLLGENEDPKQWTIPALTQLVTKLDELQKMKEKEKNNEESLKGFSTKERQYHVLKQVIEKKQEISTFKQKIKQFFEEYENQPSTSLTLLNLYQIYKALAKSYKNPIIQFGRTGDQITHIFIGELDESDFTAIQISFPKEKAKAVFDILKSRLQKVTVTFTPSYWKEFSFADLGEYSETSHMITAGE